MIEPVTADGLDAVRDLFESNATTRGCWCMWFLLTNKERFAGWGEGNRAKFEEYVKTAGTPVGVLATTDDGLPVGWCATGPRSRYPTAIGPRTRILKGRDPAEDDDVWLVPCFFVRTGGYRRSGLTHDLLEAACELARSHGARAIEGFPVTGDGIQFVGRESTFESCGFACVARPTPLRAVMRRELT